MLTDETKTEEKIARCPVSFKARLADTIIRLEAEQTQTGEDWSPLIARLKETLVEEMAKDAANG